MNWQTSVFFKTICRIVLLTFYIQNLHIINLGYGTGDWAIEFKSAMAAEIPALAVINSTPVQNTTPLKLQAKALALNDFLSPTPDANSADPYIIQKANELNHDPALIFAFVRDKIGYESYKGSLRGARGTLWSKAGNSLDKASLMIALLRASNIPARYVTGTLNDADAQKLILSMFPSPLRIVGCINAGTQVSDPANDPKLLGESKEHYWVEYGNSFQAADPSFEQSTVGQIFASIQNNFTEVPDNLRHKVNVRLKRELTSPLSGLFSGGSSQDIATVLDQTVNTVDVVGKPLSIGHFINSSTIGAIITETTNTYSPYLILANDSLDFSQDTLIRGQDYQETLTNFPLASQIATGLFLEMDVIAADGSVRTYERTLADRIGIAARQNGGGASLSVDPNQQTFVSLLDLTTISILPGKFDPAVFDAKNEEMRQLASEFTNLPQFDPGSTIDLSNEVVQSGMMQLFQRAFIATSRLRLALYEEVSDNANARLSTPAMVMAYNDSPRLTLFQTRVNQAADKSFSVNFQIDLRKYDIRTIAAPGQNPSAQIGFSLQKGLINTSLESVIMTFPNNSNGLQLKAVSAQSIWNEVISQGITTTFLAPNDTTTLSTLDINPDAVALISNAQRNGKGIITPNKSVLVDGKMRLAWFEMDLVTGELIGVLDDGGHGVIENVGVYLSKIAQKIAVEGGLGFLTAVIGTSSFHLIKTIFFSIIAHVDRYKDLAFWKNQYSIIRSELLLALEVIAKKVSFFFYAGYQAGLAFAYFNLNDPPLDNLQISPPPLGTLNIPNNQPTIVAADIAHDNLFTLPLNGAELPTMFRVGIKNNEASKDTFSLNFSNIPSGFSAQTSVPQISIPPGETAEVGVCLKPTSGVPSPGQHAPFGINITSTTNPSITQTVSEDFIVPEIHGVSVTSDQASYSTIPGTPVTVNLNFKAVGNVAENVTFSIQTTSGLTASTLNDTALALSGSATQSLILTPDTSVALNTTLTATVTATFGPSSSPQTQTLQIPIFVAAPGAQAIANASTTANQLNKPNLANRLNNLSHAMNTLVQNAADPVAKGQALAALNSIIGQLGADPLLANFAGAFILAKSALAAANTPSTIQTALNGLGNALNNFGATITQLQQHNFEATLTPSSLEAQPGIAAGFEVRIRNTGTEATTYDLSLDSLPADTTGAFNQNSVTLQSGELSSSVTASLTRSASNELLPASFKVKVALNSAPEVFQLLEGNLTVRKEFVSVASVTASPAFVNPKVTPPVLMFISAKLLNAVNRVRDAKVFFTVKNSSNQLVFTSAPVNASLTVQTSLTDAALGAFNPQGMPEGTYSVEVSVTDTNDVPIPGATGSTPLLLGSPVTAGLNNTPVDLPPGDVTTHNSLSINTKVLLPPLSVVGQQTIPGNGGQNGVAVKDTIAYVCGSTGINLFDVSNPALPTLIRTIGSGVNMGCKINGNLLLSLEQSGNQGARLLHVYSLASDPANPLPLGTSPLINYSNQVDLISNGKSAFIAQLTFCNIIGPNDIYIQLGDVLSVDLKLNDLLTPTSANPVLSDVLYNTHGDMSPDPTDIPGCAENGGDNNVWQLAFADPNTLLVASTTITGTDTQTGVGRVLVVDISDPANLTIVKEVQIPNTAHVMGIAVEGNKALVTGSTGGWRDFFTNNDPANDALLLGNLVFSTLDLTDPRNPILLASQPVSRQSRTFWSNMTALGNNRYVFSNLGGVSETPEILMIDASDPFDLAIGQTAIPKELIGPNALTGAGDLIYTTSASGLIIYKLPTLPNVPVTASVKVPNNTGLEIRNFGTAPVNIVNGTDFDTLEWHLNLPSGSSRTLTWDTLIHTLQPGEVRQTTLGGTLDFTYAGTPGQVPLNPTAVVGQQILSITPTQRTVQPGATANYQLTVKNPTSAPVSYNLAVQGVPAAWVQLVSPLALDALAEQTLDLNINVAPFTPLGPRNLVVTALADNGAQGAVHADLTIAGESIIPSADANAHGAVIALLPAAATAGQGTTAHYTVQVTNTGNTTETFNLSTVLLPGNITAVFDSPTVTIPPGASNFRQVGLSLTPAVGTLANDYPFSIQAKFDSNSQVASTAPGLLTVVNAGIALDFEQSSGNPGDTLNLRLTNIGSVEDDFNLILGGPGALSSTLTMPKALISRAINTAQPSLSIHLPAGGTTVVNVMLGEINFALPGRIGLFAQATSKFDSAVTAVADANIVSAEQQAMSATIDPSAVTLAAPGAKAFTLTVNNLGNTEDAYSAVISQTSGPISASLQGLDGNPTQSIPVFRLPALSSGVLNLNTNLTQAGTGIVKVLISSTTHPAIKQEVIAQVSFNAPDEPPVPLPTGSTDCLDGDGDDVGDCIENQVPGTRTSKGDVIQGDGNGDGILDSQQGFVTSLPLRKANSTQNESRYVTFEMRDAPTTALFGQIAQSLVTGVNTAPEHGYLNFGKLSFLASGFPVGQTVTFRVYFVPEQLVNGFWKQTTDGMWIQLGAESMKLVDGKVQVTWQVTDGGEFDSDGTRNGRLSDPGGLGFGLGIAGDDRDADGVKDALEPALGMNPSVKDNDVSRDDRFIAQLYRDLYLREADPGELSKQLSILQSDRKRVNRVIDLAIAEEFERYHISDAVRLFLAVNNRAALREELDVWRTLLKNGSQQLDVIDYFMKSSLLREVYQNGSNQDYLHALELPLLGRKLTAQELLNYANYMQSIGRPEFTRQALNVPAFIQNTRYEWLVTLIADLLLDYPLDDATLKLYSDMLMNEETTPIDLTGWVLQLELYKNRFM